MCDRGPNLKRILLILDARHGFKKTDIDYMTQLMDQVKQRGQRPSWKMQVVLTKCDLVSRHDVARRVIAVQEQMREQLPGVALSNLPIVMVSGHERRGIVQLQRELASLVPPPRPVPLNVTPASPVDTKGGAAAVKTTVSTKNAKKIKELSGKTKKSPAVKNQPEKKSTKSVPEKTNIATEIVEDTESRMQPAQKDATKDQAGLDMRNAKIAPMLRKVTKISKPTMHEYEAAAAAPPAPDSVISLTMSDRLDAILGHYLDRIADGTVIDDNKGTAKDVVSTVASSGLDINNGSNSNNEQVCSDPISPQVSTPINGYYERIGRNFKKSGKIELNFGEDGEKVKNGRKEKKNMYRTRFSRKDKN